MERARTASLYTEMIQANVRMIDNLINISPAEKASMDGYSRYQFAATVADTNNVFANVLSVIGVAPPANLKKGDDYRLEAANIARIIPIGVVVDGDRGGRLRSAFAGVFSGEGFRTGGNNSRYVLQVSLSLSEVNLGGNQNKFARYVIDANLTDTSTGEVLFPYNINGREGHVSLSEAEERAVRAAENKIKSDYPAVLREYLSQLVPKN
jgi:hypothetical protein